MNPSDDDAHEFLVEWEKYAHLPIFEHLSSINYFQLSVQFPRFRAWSSADQMHGVADCLYEEAYELLTRSKLYRYDELRRTTGSHFVGVHYEDADTDFHLELTTGAELILRRQGSSMERFYQWYMRIMPEVHKLYVKVREYLERLSVPLRDIGPARAGFVFRFILYDFRTVGRASEPVKNSTILGSSLAKVPGVDGKLLDLGSSRLGDLGRIDLAVSRWIDAPGGSVREIYKVEAPGNLDYGALWVEFTYIAETRDDSSGKRQQPDFSEFLRRYDHPVTDFLRDRALNGFLSDLTSHVSFNSTPGLLP
ncbi:hypothetical protein ACGFMK_34930 [Amycolatopsis sp. NPDC049252]|uniref:hypothetical protein n=1 Tax=Amycolatopsis sp. NPDC049252 TaxID=3363933 RepID=UPI003710575C